MQLNSSITIRNFARCSILPRNLMLIQIFKFAVNRRLVQIVWSSQKRRNLSTDRKSVSLLQLSSLFASSSAKCQSLKLTIRRMVASQSPFTSPWCQITMSKKLYISSSEWGKKALNCKSKQMQPNKWRWLTREERHGKQRAPLHPRISANHRKAEWQVKLQWVVTPNRPLLQSAKARNCTESQCRWGKQNSKLFHILD